MREIRVLFLASWYPNEMHSFAGTFIQEHAKAVARYCSVLVVYPYFVSPAAVFRGGFRWIEEGVEEGVRTIRVRVPKVRPFSVILFLLSFFVSFFWLRCRFNPHIIHAHVARPAGFLAAVLYRMVGIPYVLTEHAKPSVLIQNSIERIAIHYAYRNASLLLPVSRAVKAALEAEGIRGEARVVPNAVDFSLFHPPPLKHRSSGDPIRLAFVGSLIPLKNAPILMNAMKVLKQRGGQQLELHMIGDGPCRQEWEALATGLGLSESVRFYGTLPKREVARILQESDVLVAPSREETFGCTIIEAMACGKPVIATRCGGPEEIVSDGIGVLVSPDDVAGMSQALERVSTDLSDYDAQKIAARCSKSFSLDVVGSELRHIYEEVLR